MHTRTLQDCQGKKEDLIRLGIDSCMYVSITAVYYVFCDGSPAEQGGRPVAAEFEESMPLRRSVVHCVAVRGQDTRTGERLCNCKLTEPETRDMRKLDSFFLKRQRLPTSRDMHMPNEKKTTKRNSSDK